MTYVYDLDLERVIQTEQERMDKIISRIRGEFAFLLLHEHDIPLCAHNTIGRTKR